MSSLPLAISSIAHYSSMLEFVAGQVGVVQTQVEAAVIAKDPVATREYRAELAKLNTLITLYKDFVEFWKDVIKSILILMKMFNELAGGGGRG